MHLVETSSNEPLVIVFDPEELVFEGLDPANLNWTMPKLLLTVEVERTSDSKDIRLTGHITLVVKNRKLDADCYSVITPPSLFSWDEVGLYDVLIMEYLEYSQEQRRLWLQGAVAEAVADDLEGKVVVSVVSKEDSAEINITFSAFSREEVIRYTFKAQVSTVALAVLCSSTKEAA